MDGGTDIVAAVRELKEAKSEAGDESPIIHPVEARWLLFKDELQYLKVSELHSRYVGLVRCRHLIH